MKKLYSLLLLLFLSTISLAQTVVFQESFESGNSGTPSETCNDNSGDFFTRTDGSDIGSFYQVSGQDGSFFFAAQDTDGSPCTSAVQTLTFTGIDISTFANLTFAILVAEDDSTDGAEDWDADANVLVEINIDGAGYTNLIQFSGGGATNTEPGLDTDFDGTADGTLLSPTFQEFTAAAGTGSSADIRITFNNLNAGDEDIALDNIRLVNDFVASSTIAITSPSNGTEFIPGTTSINVEFSTTNAPNDSQVDISVNGNKTTDVGNSPFAVATTDGESYTVLAELVSGGNVLDSKSIDFSVASISQVSSISGLRAGTEGNYYELTSEAIVTYTRSNRNQKYIEDAAPPTRGGKSASGSGILIDDSDGIIMATYNEGDGITGLKGRLSSFNDVLQFVPIEDPGAPSSTGNTITPEVATNAQLAANWENYESELVEIKAATFVNPATANFEAGENYTINDGTSDLTFRTNFSEADYIGQPIPTTPQNLVVLVGEFNGTPQVIARSLSDLTLRVDRNSIKGFSIYPNPVTNGILRINTLNNDLKSVEIFDILGKRILSKKMTNTQLNVSKLNSGVYILKVSENGKTATRKLVIR